MSKTLFWYVFRDLLKIFLMASGVLAGIMAFGGLFKPLMEYGLNGAQVLEMLGYLMPATQTYSLPIAALFATTMVYGRLAADNEITACRAAGISQTALAQPAFVLGLSLAIGSIFGLMWVVPHFSLKVEKVAFTSMAEFVRKNIERTHQVKLEGFTIFAESAHILPPPPAEHGGPAREAFVLTNPVFCTDKEDHATKVRVPDKFYTAKQATVVIRQGEDNVEFSAKLDEGTTFPRDFQGAALGGVGTTDFGPIPLPSPIRENTKFMTIEQLQKMHEDPKRSREIKKLYAQITQQEQEDAFLASLVRTMRAERQLRFVSGAEEWRLMLAPGAKQLGRPKNEVMYTSVDDAKHIRLERRRGGVLLATDLARQLTLRVQSDPEADRMRLAFELQDAAVAASADPSEPQPEHKSFSRFFSVPMTPELLKIENRGPSFYLEKENTSLAGQNLKRKLSRLQSSITAEMHGRASFGVSCFILVLVGSALGMMFRTGNFLSAFALSVMPALLCIALIVTGQHVAEADARNLALGLSIIWSGNVLVLVMGVVLFANLRRQ